MRRILALLVVLALSLSLGSLPAGSATLQRQSAKGSGVATVTNFMEGDGGEDIDGGDDDRWGNTDDPIQGDDDPNGTAGDDGEDDGELGDDRMLFGRTGVLQIEIRTLFGFLLILL